MDPLTDWPKEHDFIMKVMHPIDYDHVGKKYKKQGIYTDVGFYKGMAGVLQLNWKVISRLIKSGYYAGD
jgi:hypothetical protein